MARDDPDFAIRDLYNAIAQGDYPSYTMYIQVMSFEVSLKKRVLFVTLEPPKYSNSNSPNLCFCLLKGDKKTFLLVENIFWTNENVFLSPFNKK